VPTFVFLDTNACIAMARPTSSLISSVLYHRRQRQARSAAASAATSRSLSPPPSLPPPPPRGQSEYDVQGAALARAGVGVFNFEGLIERARRGLFGMQVELVL